MRLVRIFLFSFVIVFFSTCNIPNWDAKFKEVRKPMNALAEVVEENHDSLFSYFRTNQYSNIAFISLKKLETQNNMPIPANEIRVNMRLASVDGITFFCRNNAIIFDYKINNHFFTTSIYSWCYYPSESLNDSSLSPIHIKQITPLHELRWYHVESFTNIAD